MFNFTSLKYKIVVIFIIPALGMLYFSSKYVSEKYTSLQDVKKLTHTIDFAKNASKLIHELQKERGLGSGYLGKDYMNFTHTLQKQRVLTDIAYKNFLNSISHETTVVEKVFSKKIKDLLIQLQKISAFRKYVDKRDIDFYKELDFYSKIIDMLTSSIPHLNNKFNSLDISDNMESLFYLINMKEYAGIERAYLSNIFSQNKITNKQFKNIQELIIKEDLYYKKFVEYSSIKNFQSYQKNITPSILEELEKYRNLINTEKIFNINSMQWFSFASKRINKLNIIIQEIMQDILTKSESIKNNSYNALFISALFWILSLLALAVLSYILRKLINMEEKNINQIQEQRKHYNALSYMSEDIIYLDNEDDLYNSLCKILVEVSKFKIAWIGLIDEEKKSIIPYIANNITLEELSQLKFTTLPDKSKNLKMPERAYFEKNHFILKDNDLHLCDSHIKIFDKNIKSAGSFPIYKNNGVIAVLSIYSEKDDVFNLELIDLIEKMLKGISFALNKIQEQRIQLRTKDDLRIASYAFDAQEAMTITDINANIIKVNKAFSEITGYSAEEVIGKNPKVLQSSYHKPYFYQQMWQELKETGKWKGEIYNKRKNGNIYPEMLSITAIKDENNITTNYIAQFLDISDIKNAQKEAEYKAQHDNLTNTINREKLLQETEKAFNRGKRTNIQHAFLFLDIDNFKQVNDFYGHKVGDELLIKIALKLKASLRDGDILARLGGDEFAIVAIELDYTESNAVKKATKLVKKIQQIMLEPIIIDSQSFEITFSIGIKLFPNHEKTYLDVVSHADIAMYQAKKSGRNQFAFFNHELDFQSKRFSLIENDLKQAIKYDELELYYQPKININTDKIVGFEALLRWNHPTKGLLQPDNFLDVANDTMLIHDVGKYTINQACKQLSLWGKQSKDKNYSISINISAHQFQKREFVSDVKDILNKYNIDASLLEIELLEDTIIKNLDVAIEKIQTLKSLGIRFSIDDFGTGYSSMTYLQKLPVDSIKIDKSFIMDLDKKSNQEIVKMVINFTKIFGLHVIAEGVDNIQALKFLKENGCDEYQGFYFSKALHVEDIMKLLNKNTDIL